LNVLRFTFEDQGLKFVDETPARCHRVFVEMIGFTLSVVGVVGREHDSPSATSSTIRETLFGNSVSMVSAIFLLQSRQTPFGARARSAQDSEPVDPAHLPQLMQPW